MLLARIKHHRRVYCSRISSFVAESHFELSQYRVGVLSYLELSQYRVGLLSYLALSRDRVGPFSYLASRNIG